MLSGLRSTSAVVWGFAVMISAIAGCSDDTKPLDTTPPAAVSDLEAADSTISSITLHWTAPSDEGSSGGAAEYDIRYAALSINEASWSTATRVSGEPKPNSPGTTDTLTVTGLLPGTHYYFALKTVDKESNWSALSNVLYANTRALPDTVPPSAVEDLSAGDPTEHSVILRWTAPGDDEVAGKAAQYDIRHSTLPITDGNWESATEAGNEPNPKTAGSSETFTVKGLAPDSTYYFALKTADEKQNWSALSNVAGAKTLREYLWSPMGEGMDNIVNALTIFDGKLIAAGQFVTADGINVRRIATWDGSSWSALGSGMNEAVFALAVYNGQLIAGGEFTSAGGAPANRIAAWNGSSWSALGTGTNDIIHTLAVYDGKLIAGGRFTFAGGNAANYIAAWDGASWAPLGSGMSGGYSPWVMGLGVYDGQLIAGGAFTAAGAVLAGSIARWDGATWAPLGSGCSSYVTVFRVFDNQLIAGGAFTVAGGASCNHIARWNGSYWAALGSGLNGNVTALSVYDGQLVAGGFFNIAGVASADVAVWDGSDWSSVGLGFDNNSPKPAVVYGLMPYNGRLIAGGWFTRSGMTPLGNIAAWTN